MIKSGALSGKGNRVTVMLALFLGLLAAVLTIVFLSSNSGGSGGGGSGVTLGVVVAAKDIAAGTPIQADMLAVKSVPKELVLTDSFTKPDDVVGKVTRAAILSGEQVAAGRLVGSGQGGDVFAADDLADAVPLERAAAQCKIDRCGQRGTAVGVAKVTSSGGLVRAGDHVDVILAFKDGSAITILQDIEVLAIDQDLAQVVSNDSEGGKAEERAVVSGSEENPEATTATLAVWPNDAQKLTAGEEFTKGVKLTLSDALVAQFGLQDNAQVECEGSVRLALRHAGQQGPVKLEPHGVCASLFNTIWG